MSFHQHSRIHLAGFLDTLESYKKTRSFCNNDPYLRNWIPSIKYGIFREVYRLADKLAKESGSLAEIQAQEARTHVKDEAQEQSHGRCPPLTGPANSALKEAMMRVREVLGFKDTVELLNELVSSNLLQADDNIVVLGWDEQMRNPGSLYGV